MPPLALAIRVENAGHKFFNYDPAIQQPARTDAASTKEPCLCGAVFFPVHDSKQRHAALLRRDVPINALWLDEPDRGSSGERGSRHKC